MKKVLFGILFLSFPLISFALSTEEVKLPAAEFGLKTAPVITFGYVMQLIFSLLIIIGILYAVAKFIMPRLNPIGSRGLIKILDRQFMDAQSMAYIISVGKKKWLVIIAKGQIACVDKLEDENLCR